ncbi:quinone oxidoreductase [Pedobacter psychrodurus]|uniref:Quinone oxidoreductase n=1 Tax=Pedobacter psychrodurus TaxID=2530456 RepID=A0A4R0Q328_9SPHI|nr:quinone oxidoreductase [Pedobacter psychrodurus]TCD28763.1 quinone oxidoreductase [Pedobacter psychrodurus]
MKALTLTAFGNSDVLEYKEIDNPVLKNGEILVEMKTIGLNFADLMRRNGTYPMKGNAPYINGFEGAGIVKDSNDHPEIKIGDRVAFADVPFANAELVAVPFENVIPLPDEISFEIAASVMLQGLTAHYLTTDSHHVEPGEIVLIHAAAGGVGQLLIQICKLLSATVIGLTSSESKKETALLLGADAVFLYDQDWTAQVLEIYPQGVDVVYESIGITMESSLAVTKILGQVVLFGLAGGKLELGNPLWIIAHSKTITGGDLWNYLTSKEERLIRSKLLFEWIISGKVKISEPTIFKLSDGKKAHDLMEARVSTGKILMVPLSDNS